MSPIDLPTIKINNKIGHEYRDIYRIRTKWSDMYGDGHETGVFFSKPEMIEQTILEILFFSQALQDKSSSNIDTILLENQKTFEANNLFNWYYSPEVGMHKWDSYGLDKIDIVYFNPQGVEMENSFNEELQQQFKSYLFDNFLEQSEDLADDEQFLAVAMKIGQSVNYIKEKQKINASLKTNSNSPGLAPVLKI